MSSYTITLKEVCELYAMGEATSEKDRIEITRKKIFDFDYPIFDETYRNVFETHFIRNFYFREIGFETEGLFKFQLETWLLINMPYWNKMFESELIDFDPLSNTKTDTTHNKTNDQSQKSSSTTNGTNKSNNSQTSTGSSTDDDFERDIEADTPDNRLGLTATDGQGLLDYASNIKENTKNNSRNTNASTNGNATDTSNVTSNANGSINSIEDYVSSKTGKIGVQTYSKMLAEYREVLLKLEKKVFKDMNELFMLVY